MSLSMSGVVSSNLCLHSKPLGRMALTRMPPPIFSSHPSPPPPLSFSSSLPMLPILLSNKTPRRSKYPPKIVGFTSNDIKVGSSIEVDGAPWRVLEFLHVKPGKGAAFVRTKIRNFITGNTVDKTFRAGTTIVQADVAKETKQFTYKEGSQYVFMDLLVDPAL